VCSELVLDALVHEAATVLHAGCQLIARALEVSQAE